MTTMTQIAKIPPFQRVLVPYDGSEPADSALGYAIALGRAGSKVDLVHVIDEAAAVSSSTSSMMTFDPTPLLEAMNEQGRSLLHAAQERCRTSGVEPTVTILHDQPAAGLITFAEQNDIDLIVMGTHARSGLPRMFLGSTTEGVLHAGTVPVLAVRGPMHPDGSLFRNLLVAVDDSDPAVAAAAMAGSLSRASGAKCTFCHTIDTAEIYARASTYGYEAQPFVDTLRSLGDELITHAQASAGLTNGESTATIIEDATVHGILAVAQQTHADAIVIGSHGRRGLRRLVLGSVAEHIVRVSPVPVFVVRCSPRAAKHHAGVAAPAQEAVSSTR
jgi:nucleotide-binding universal stress UspA family protein